jgi:DNA-binding response OmpR family regulator
MAEIMLVRWPEDGEEGARLAEAGVAVLYLIDRDTDPPTPTTCLEDWVRLPGDDRDVSARVAALERRAAAHHGPPRVDEHGLLHYHGGSIALASEEAHLAQTLTEHFGAVVADRELVEQLAVDGPSLRHQMAQLRARLRPLSLSVARVRREGYLLREANRRAGRGGAS